MDIMVNLFSKKVSKSVANRTVENMERYGMSLSDAFEEAARSLAKNNTELWAAWYFCDFRKFIPFAYLPKYLDFKKYPTRYVRINGKYVARSAQ